MRDGFIFTIGEAAFYSCYMLESVYLKVGLSEIGSSAFSDCFALTNIDITPNVRTIGQKAFSGCHNIKTINLDCHMLNVIPERAFFGCSATEGRLVIPSGVTSIERSAFSECGFDSVVIPRSVTSIGQMAFNNCYSLTDIYYQGTEAEWNAIDMPRLGNEQFLNIRRHYNYGG
jgi:hypothetical protein